MLRRYFGKISPLNINVLVGKDGELVIDDTDNSVYIMDGQNPGGFKIFDGHTLQQDLTNIDANIIPYSNNYYSLGNTSNQWSRIHLSNALVLNGRTVTAQGSTLYINGVPVTGGGGIGNVYLDVEPPVSSIEGQLWYSTDDGRLYIYYDDTWVDANPTIVPPPETYVGNLIIDNTTISSSYINGPITFESNLLPLANVTYSLGSPTYQWKDLYVSNNTIYISGIPLSVDVGGNLLVNGNTVTGGGGISPTQPYIELTNDAIVWTPYANSLVTFTKTDNGDERDEIDTNLAITRGNNQGIYNPYLEPDWDNTSSDGPSPAGTLWNKDGWEDLTNLNQRIYFSFYDTFLRFGNNVLAAEAVMYDTANDKYYKVDFTVWGNANQGAPVSYTRTQIHPTSGATIGDPVEFVKVGYADPTLVNDPIDTNLTIARGNNQSIYNIAIETGYSQIGDGEDSPEGTEWNADGWNNFRDVARRSYDTFMSVMDYQIGNNVLNKELVMHDTINDKYYAIKFTQWTQNNQGGGFSYTRQLINTSQYFIKTDYGSEVDILIDDDGEGSGVGITRGENQGIYNPFREEGWDEDVSPDGTLWNIDGWDDLTDIENRNYQTFYNAFGQGGIGNKVVGTQCVVYLPDNNSYYLIKFLSWTQNSEGGGFSYERYELDLTKLNEGIKFADGSILKSANDFNRIKSTASGNRRIEEVSGSKTVNVTSRTTNNITTTASRAGVNTNQIWIDSTATTIDDIISDTNAYGITDTQTIQFSLDNSTWYTFTGSTGFSGNERGYSILTQVTYNQGDTVYFRYSTGAAPQVWWDKNDLPSGGINFRGAVIDYHAYSGEATWIGTIHIVDDSGEEHISHNEVASGSTDAENDDLWLVQNEGTISYRRIDGESKTLKVHWTAKVFYGSEYYD